MAATVNLPVAQKIPPATDKVATDAPTTPKSDNGGFSQALHQQMDKQQSSSSTRTAEAPEKSNISEKKQSVSDGSPSQSTPASSQDKTVVASEGEQSQQSQTDDAQPDPIDAAVLASMQAPMAQPNPLRELIALSLQAGNGQQADGKLLPEVASHDPAQSKVADIMKLLGLRTAMSGQNAHNNQVGDSALPPGLQLLQQRIAQQIASQTQNPQQSDSNGDTPTLDLKQLQGLENALLSFTKAAENGDGKGLAVAREQLLNRLQAIQTQGGDNVASDSSADDLPGLLKSLTQQMSSAQANAHGQAGDAAKMARVAFQDILGKLNPQANQQDVSLALGASSSAAMSAGLSGISPSQGAQSQQGMQFMAPSTTVNVPVHDQTWGQAIGERLQWMVKQDMKQAEIKLNPRHLGPIEVKISMNNDQATVSFAAHHVVTRDALENAVPRLREMFGDNGLNLLDVNVSHHSDSREQQANSGGDQRQQGGGFWSHVDGSGSEPMVSDIRTPQWFGSNRMLDTYV